MPERFALIGTSRGSLTEGEFVELVRDAVCGSGRRPAPGESLDRFVASVRFARLDDDWRTAKPRWSLDLDKLFALCDARTKAIFINSPGNPTGWIMSREEQRA